MSVAAHVEEMFKQDLFSQWLGIEILQLQEGFCQLQMTVRKEMCNGFNIAHGGIAYSLADSALAFASNSPGRQALSIETSIAHIKPLVVHDVILATTRQISLTNKIGIYEVTIQKEASELVAIFKGIVYRR